MNRSIDTSVAGRARRIPTVRDVQRHGWLIGLIAAGLVAPWIVR